MANRPPPTTWPIPGTGRWIQSDDEGIAEFEKAGLVSGIRWAEMRSYGLVGDPAADGSVMEVHGASGRISFPLSLPGFTVLNSTIIRHLPPGVLATGVDLRSLLPVALTDAKGSRRFGRFGMIPWTLLIVGVGIVFCVALPQTGKPVPPWFYGVPAFFLLFGIGGLIAALNERYMVTSDGITSYNWLGRKRAQIAWSDVVALEFKRREIGGRRGGGPTDYYTLLGRHSHIDLDSLITDWDDLVRTIFSHAPPKASIDLGPASLPL